jgi:transcription initiation factor TFIIIB Brf1 subunit/transcription initiation factor TFIIB
MQNILLGFQRLLDAGCQLAKSEILLLTTCCISSTRKKKKDHLKKNCHCCSPALYIPGFGNDLNHSRRLHATPVQNLVSSVAYMDTSASSSRFAAAAVVVAALLLSSAGGADWQQWQEAHATFYGDESGADTMRKTPYNLSCSAAVRHAHART